MGRRAAGRAEQRARLTPVLGVTSSTIWYVDDTEPTGVLRGAIPDRESARALAATLHPGLDVTYLGDEPLSDAVKPEPGEVVVGRYPGVAVVRTGEALPPTPSTLVEHWIRPTGATHTYLSSSTVHTAAGSWGAFAHWEDGELKRSFSATPVHIIEDLGLPQVWERPYWAGEHPAPPVMDVLPDPQTLPFDPGAFAEGAPAAWLGDDLDLSSITVCRFAVHPTGQVPESVRRAQERLRAEQARVEQLRAEQARPEQAARPQRRSLFARLFRRER
ncbi:DUF6928 family protein [Prescottella equi]|uniref:DUF6928 family protein n=2 Tax=Rhodococcus hoagii TaxID=43767 RepID=UPI001F16C33D|nr:hypothetical protein [Prescottella equi]